MNSAKGHGITERLDDGPDFRSETGLSEPVAGSKTMDRLPATLSDGPLSLTRPLNKCLDYIRFHYTLLDVCAEFSFVCGNNQRMLLQSCCTTGYWYWYWYL